jgi:hypothetical protein
VTRILPKSVVAALVISLLVAAAVAARGQTVNDTARLHLVGGSGNALIEEGHANGTLPGRTRVQLTVATIVTARFTIYVHGGSITGHGSARLHPGLHEYDSFGGSLVVTHGTGRYAHASGSGQLYGTINRSNHDAVVQVIGQLNR